MTKNDTEIEELTQRLIKFRDERNWEQFHNSKDLALALSIEAAELNELYLWKKAEDVNVEKLKEELADVFMHCSCPRSITLTLSKLSSIKYKLTKKNIPLTKRRTQPRNITSYETIFRIITAVYSGYGAESDS
ncbi:MAG: nucleotide pyrophosphohydrolase [Nitrospiraceae bacterium]|nr:nucleotide pyrophosphohydrolase [Nitrospiraceae bacterium]